MKRELLNNVKVQPVNQNTIIDREGFLSAVIGAEIGAEGSLTVTVTHSDNKSDFSEVKDALVFPEKYTQGGTISVDRLKTGEILNVDVDLNGLKRYIKIVTSGTANSSTTVAIALGN